MTGQEPPTSLDAMIEVFLGSTDMSDPKVRRRLRILEGATELFIAQGYRKTSVDEVARAAGVAKGTVYLYFRNKAELLMAAIVLEEKAHVGRVQAILDADVTPRERLKRWLANSLSMVSEMPLTSRLLQGDSELVVALEELPPDVLERSQEMSQGFTKRLVAAAAAPLELEPEQLEAQAAVIGGLVYFAGVLDNPQVRGKLSLAQFSATLAELVVDGCSGDTSAPR